MGEGMCFWCVTEEQRVEHVALVKYTQDILKMREEEKDV